MDLGTCLGNLGLGQFQSTFRDNGIDETVLPHLTEAHLREMGLPLGARIKLLAAIATLATETQRRSTADTTTASAAAGSAERRQVTVLSTRRCCRT